MDIKNKIEEILLTDYQYIDCYTVDKLLVLFAVSKRHLIENILDDVKQSHSEYAVEKIESYLDDDC